MRKLAMVVALALVTTVGAAAAPIQSSCALAQTCHEECALKCWHLYPNNPAKRNLCTWSCIDQQCGGGPYP